MNQPKPSSPPKKLSPQEEMMTVLVSQNLQYQRTVWMLVQAAGGEVTIDEAQMNPLWNIKYHRDKEHPTKLTIKAEQLPEPTEHQLRTLAERVLLNEKPIHVEALQVGLQDYPGSYIYGRSPRWSSSAMANG